MKITVVLCALATLSKALPTSLHGKSQEKEREKLHLASEPTKTNLNKSVDSRLADNKVMKPNPYATHHLYNFNDRSAQQMAEYQDHWSNIFLHAQKQNFPVSHTVVPDLLHSSHSTQSRQAMGKSAFGYKIILCNTDSGMPDSLKVRGSDLLHSYNVKLAMPWDADIVMYPTYRNVRPGIRKPGFKHSNIPWSRRFRQATIGCSEEWCMPFDANEEVALFTDTDLERFGIPSTWSQTVVYIPFIVAPRPLPRTITPPAWWCRCIDDDYIFYMK